MNNLVQKNFQGENFITSLIPYSKIITVRITYLVLAMDGLSRYHVVAFFRLSPLKRLVVPLIAEVLRKGLQK